MSVSGENVFLKSVIGWALTVRLRGGRIGGAECGTKEGRTEYAMFLVVFVGVLGTSIGRGAVGEWALND